MQIEPLDFTHQHLLEGKFRQLNLPLSEYSFANLYLFRQIHRYEVLTLDGKIFIKGLTRDQIPFIMLTDHPAQIPFQTMQKASEQAQVIFPIPENWLSLFEKQLVQASFKEAESDYLYATSKFATYAGRHLDGKRNQVKQLLKEHEVRSEPLLQQLEDAQRILDDWQKGHAETETDFLACQEAIQNFHRLNLQGRITSVNQEPAGFSIGEWLSMGCYVVHFCKTAHPTKGLYQYLYQDLAQTLEGNYQWINLEQDLGIASLRYSKLSYQPNFLLKKWRLELQFKHK
jgi:uncharacterized protein